MKQNLGLTIQPKMLQHKKWNSDRRFLVIKGAAPFRKYCSQKVLQYLYRSTRRPCCTEMLLLMQYRVVVRRRAACLKTAPTARLSVATKAMAEGGSSLSASWLLFFQRTRAARATSDW